MMIKLEDLIKLSVEQLLNKNQFVIKYQEPRSGAKWICFQSYQSVIALYNPSTARLLINWSKWDYSKTTLKHLKAFINEYTPFSYTTKADFYKFISSSACVVLFEE